MHESTSNLATMNGKQAQLEESIVDNQTTCPQHEGVQYHRHGHLQATLCRGMMCAMTEHCKQLSAKQEPTLWCTTYRE